MTCAPVTAPARDRGELRPGTGEAVRRFFSYFTIQSNLLVAATTLALAVGRGVGSRLWAVARLAAMVGITVTGVVHLLLLRPILHLTGADWWADLQLHAVVPVLALVGWLVLGPRGRVSRADVWPALVWPVLWLVATLALGPLVHWTGGRAAGWTPARSRGAGAADPGNRRRPGLTRGTPLHRGARSVRTRVHGARRGRP